MAGHAPYPDLRELARRYDARPLDDRPYEPLPLADQALDQDEEALKARLRQLSYEMPASEWRPIPCGGEPRRPAAPLHRRQRLLAQRGRSLRRGPPAAGRARLPGRPGPPPGGRTPRAAPRRLPGAHRPLPAEQRDAPGGPAPDGRGPCRTGHGAGRLGDGGAGRRLRGAATAHLGPGQGAHGGGGERGPLRGAGRTRRGGRPAGAAAGHRGLPGDAGGGRGEAPDAALPARLPPEPAL